MSMIKELSHFLRLQIRQQEWSIFISQSKYAKNLVKKFGLEFVSLVRTPMSPNVKLIVDLLGKSVDSSLYRSMIGSLLYLIASRLDISYNVGVCARYQVNPKESHMIALKRIIKYVKTTVDFRVWYSKDTNDVLVGYSDADWVGNVDDRKSTLGFVFMWVIIPSPGWVRSIILSHYPLLGLNTSLPVVVAPNFCGCKNSLIMLFIKNILPFIVTIPVPLTSLKILCNIFDS